MPNVPCLVCGMVVPQGSLGLGPRDPEAGQDCQRMGLAGGRHKAGAKFTLSGKDWNVGVGWHRAAIAEFAASRTFESGPPRSGFGGEAAVCTGIRDPAASRRGRVKTLGVVCCR